MYSRYHKARTLYKNNLKILPGVTPHVAVFHCWKFVTWAHRRRHFGCFMLDRTCFFSVYFLVKFSFIYVISSFSFTLCFSLITILNTPASCYFFSKKYSVQLFASPNSLKISSDQNSDVMTTQHGGRLPVASSVFLACFLTKLLFLFKPQIVMLPKHLFFW